MLAVRASCPSSSVVILWCTATSCCCGVPVTGLFGFSVKPGPWMKSSHAAPNHASESTTAAFAYLFIINPRSMMECNGNDHRAAERRAEPVDATIRVCGAACVRFRIETRIIRPQREVAARDLQVQLAHSADLLH